MKCKFKYPVLWFVQVADIRPFQFEGWEYDFISHNRFITHIQVTVPVLDTDLLPELVEKPETNELDLRWNTPASHPKMLKSLRTLEGFLAVYGLVSIALDEEDISWIPESEDDKKKLKLTAFSIRPVKHPTSAFSMPFSVVSRSIIESKSALNLEIPLSFYRKGRKDFMEHRYIDAIYDFYFMLETLFGNGKTKNSHISQEFLKSTMLVTFASEVIGDAERNLLARSGRTNLVETFRKRYAEPSGEKFLKQLVILRGFLHHHSIENSRIWNPSSEYEYEVEAVLLSHLCFKVCAKEVEGLICRPCQYSLP